MVAFAWNWFDKQEIPCIVHKTHRGIFCFWSWACIWVYTCFKLGLVQVTKTEKSVNLVTVTVSYNSDSKHIHAASRNEVNKQHSAICDSLMTFRQWRLSLSLGHRRRYICFCWAVGKNKNMFGKTLASSEKHLHLSSFNVIKTQQTMVLVSQQAQWNAGEMNRPVVFLL